MTCISSQTSPSCYELPEKLSNNTQNSIRTLQEDSAYVVLAKGENSSQSVFQEQGSTNLLNLLLNYFDSYTIYSGENKYLNPCRFRKFGHLQRNV